MPIASEACFTIKEHVNCVEARISKLKKINYFPEINLNAIRFIENNLSKAWASTMKHVKESVQRYDLNFDEHLSPDDKCVSPSDFGFHNAILKKGTDELYFIDFEYAGIDDPAKMVCDFFCQPEVPVPFKYFDSFVNTVASVSANPERLKQRIAILLPVYRIKWCCILLNEFLDIGSEKRNFAHEKNNSDKIKLEQLEKARRYLKSSYIKIN